MKEYKVIHVNIFNPKQALFRSVKSDKAEAQIYSCCNSENCPLYKEKSCLMLGNLFSCKCPYGKKQVDYGFTSKAKKFYSWINDYTTLYREQLNVLQLSKPILTEIGEYIYLPLPYLSKLDNILYRWAELDAFMLKENFTIENIVTLLTYKPKALFSFTFDDEIKSYQKEDVPRFISQLKVKFPELYSELVLKFPEYGVKPVNVLGKQALLTSLNKNISVTICRVSYFWDGEYLTTRNYPVIFKEMEWCELKIKPKAGLNIKITDPLQVNEGTIYT